MSEEVVKHSGFVVDQDNKRKETKYTNIFYTLNAWQLLVNCYHFLSWQQKTFAIDCMDPWDNSQCFIINLLVKFFPEETRHFEAFVKLCITVICELLASFPPLLPFSKPLSLPFPRKKMSVCWWGYSIDSSGTGLTVAFFCYLTLCSKRVHMLSGLFHVSWLVCLYILTVL